MSRVVREEKERDRPADRTSTLAATFSRRELKWKEDYSHV
jgi:hypothetical protein